MALSGALFGLYRKRGLAECPILCETPSKRAQHCQEQSLMHPALVIYRNLNVDLVTAELQVSAANCSDPADLFCSIEPA